MNTSPASSSKCGDHAKLDELKSKIKTYVDNYDGNLARIGVDTIKFAKKCIREANFSESTASRAYEYLQNILEQMRSMKKIGKESGNRNQEIATQIKNACHEVLFPEWTLTEVPNVKVIRAPNPLSHKYVLQSLPKVISSHPGFIEWKDKICFPDTKCAYKGSDARIALKLKVLAEHADEPEIVERITKSLLAEFPKSDVDVIIDQSHGDKISVLSKDMGADLDGTEIVENYGGEEMLQTYFKTRDITGNQILLQKNSLRYTQEAYDSILTGSITASNRKLKGIFGMDIFRYRDHEYMTARALHRLVKFVSEDKFSAFEIPAYNTSIQMGIFWSVLIRKFLRKLENAGTDTQAYERYSAQLSKMYSCAQQLGQTTASTPEQFVEEQLIDRKEFRFNDLDEEGVIKWMVMKGVIFAQKTLRHKQGIYGGEIPEPTDESVLSISPQLPPEGYRFTVDELKTPLLWKKLKESTRKSGDLIFPNLLEFMIDKSK